MSSNHESMEMQLTYLDILRREIRIEQMIADDKVRLANRLWHGWFIATFGSIIISIALALFSTSTCT